jgi:uncharacterized protein YndB with AHSA1/START domain
MRFMILVKASPASEAGTLPDESLFAAMAAYHEALARAGVLLDAAGLQPSAQGWRVRYHDGQARVLDGPFTESKELVAGYTLIDVRSREEAMEWARRFPSPHGVGVDGGEIEVRPLYELDDLGDSPAVERFRELTADPAAARKTLRYSTRIAAPRRTVWHTMLQPSSFREWTRPFCEGSFYEGSWEQGRQIRFLSPEGSGLVAEIAENRPLERIDIRFLGEVQGAADDADGARPSSWLGAHERYVFADDGAGATRLDVEMDIGADHEAAMNASWPAALERLKALCETAGSSSSAP